MKSKKDETDSPSELLVIDDLERHSKQLSVEDILGHLHERYVLKGTRILFLCDETEIRDRNQFSKCKEKYIRREYRFPELDAELLLDVIEARYRKYNKPHAEVTTIINDLIRLSKQYGVSNLRTICAIMDGYVELVERLDTPKFFKSIGPYLIEHMFPLYNERSNGNLSVKDLANCGDLDQLEMVGYSAILGKASGAAKNQNSANELTYPEQFAARYEGLPHRWSLRKPVFRFVIGNELDEKAFVESFADRLEAGDSTRRALETVFAFYEYDEKPLQRAIQTVLSGIDADRYSLGELVKLMLVFRQIKEHDYVSDASWSHVVLSKVLNSVRRQSKQAKAVAEANSLSMSWMSGEIEQSGASKEQLAVVDEIRKIAKRSKASEIDSKLDRLFTALKHHDTKGIWDNYPVGDSETELLVRFVEAGYADRFAQLGTYGLRWLSQYVQNRLIHTELSSPVKSVVEAIDAIVESVRKSIEIQWVTKPKKARLVEFITVLKDAREHLANQPEMNNEPKSKQSDDSMFHRNSQ